MTWLDTWRQKQLEAISLESQSKVASVEAEYALAMHKAESFGQKGAPAVPQPQSQPPAQHYAPPAQQQPQGQAPQGNYFNFDAQAPAQPFGDGKCHCEICNMEIQDSNTSNGVLTVQKKLEISRKNYKGHLLCYKCQKIYPKQS